MSATPAAHYRMFGHYSAWANGRLYEAVARLPSNNTGPTAGAFFKSVHGTLNHLLVTDRICMQGFTGMGDPPGRLDAILFETFDELAPELDLLFFQRLSAKPAA